MDKKVTAYIEKQNKWSQELSLLRPLFLDLGLEETVKWSAPVYVHKGKNIVGMASFKNYFGIWFFQGSFLKDDAKVLMNAQEGKTQAMRQWRFASKDELDLALVKAYVLEAMTNSEKGLAIKPKRNTKPLLIPDELTAELENNQELKEKFEAFTLSKKREFCDHIAEAKREATKLKRLEKIIPMIKEGKGLYDKYKK